MAVRAPVSWVSVLADWDHHISVGMDLTIAAILLGILFSGEVMVQAQTKPSFDSEAESGIPIDVDGQVRPARLWIGRVNVIIGPDKEYRSNLISIQPYGSNQLWWIFNKGGNRPAAESIAIYKSMFRCALDDDAITCFSPDWTGFIVRTCRDTVSPLASKEYLWRRFTESGGLERQRFLLNAYTRISTSHLKSLERFHFDGYSGVSVVVDIQSLLKRADGGWTIKLHRANGKTATIVLNKELKAVSGVID